MTAHQQQQTETTTEILAVVDNVIRLKRDTLGPKLFNEIKTDLVRQNPAWHQMQGLKRGNEMRYRHAKMPPMTITSYVETQDSLIVPRGYRQRLLELSSAYDKEIRFINTTIHFPRIVETRKNDDLVLRSYQALSVTKMALAREGVVVAPCGAGKTVIGIAAIAAIAQPTLVLVHTTELLAQWQQELASKTLLPGGIGQYGAGKKTQGQVVVGLIQALVRMDAGKLQSYLNQFGMVLLDECHHCPASTFLQIVNQCPATYRFGLTATPNRKDGMEFLMHDTIGDVLYEVTDETLVEVGRSQTCDVKTIITHFYSIRGADEWSLLINELTEDNERNTLIADQVAKSWDEGHFPLVLSDRVQHCELLATMLRKRGMTACVLKGNLSKLVRQQIVNDAKCGRIDVLIGTKIADEGLDIPQLSALHLTCPSNNRAALQQRTGRIRRPVLGKTSVIYDYVDHRIASFARMANKRRGLYKRWGFKLQ